MPSISRDGVALAYDRSTAGQPLVFIHGWCCDRTYFAPQVEHFAGLGHAVLALDLRGHGESDAPDGPYSMQVLRRRRRVALRRTRREAAGRRSATAWAASSPSTLPSAIRIWSPALAMIDSAVFRPEASRAALPAFLERLQGPGPRRGASGLCRPVPDPSDRRRGTEGAHPCRHAEDAAPRDGRRAAGHVRLGPDRGRGQRAAAVPVHRQQRPGRSAISAASPRWCRA